MLFLVSMLHLEAFDFAKPQVWFWMGAYAVFPLWGAWLYFGRGAGATATRRPADPVLLAIGVVCLLLAAGLLALPAQMIAVWPWKLPPLLASIYAGPFLAYGISALMLAREGRAGGPADRSSRACSPSRVLAVVASLLHLALFSFATPSAWVWFGALAVTGAVLALRLLQARRS